MSVPLRLQRTCVATYLAAIALQFYAAGLGIFGAASFVPHALLGYGLIVGAITLTVLTLLAGFERRVVALAATLIGLTMLQPLLALVLRPAVPAVAALHALNALAIFALAALVARRTARPAA